MKFQNCVQCAVGRAIPFGSFVGIPFIKYSCRHTDQLCITLYRSKLHLCISLCILFLIMATCGLNVMNLKNSLNKDVAFSITIIYTSDLMLNTLSMLAMLICMLSINTIIAVINTAQRIVDQWQELTSKILLSKLNTFELRTKIYRDLIFVGVLMGGLIVILFYIDSNPNWSLAEKVGTVFCSYVNLMVVVLLDTVANLYLYMFSNYQNHLKNELIEALYVSKNLSNWLISCGQLHIKLKKLILLFNSYINPTLIMWLVASVILLICDTSLVVICFLESESNPVSVRIVVILLIQCLFVLLMTYFVLMATCLKTLANDVLNFLYKYPISRLTPEEAIQFEIVKSLLIKQRPTIVASGMVLIDVTLLGAITGTVLTYVVVAVQFEVLIWSRK